jgi:hypothetical protein
VTIFDDDVDFEALNVPRMNSCQYYSIKNHGLTSRHLGKEPIIHT